MLFRGGSRHCAVRICKAFFVLALFVACVAPVKNDEEPVNNRLLAESSLMKKRLPLIERENDVLRTENLQHRSKIKDLENQVQKLGAELADLNKKYNDDMADSELHILDLQEMLEILEKESSEKIAELNSKNEDLEQKLKKEVKELNLQIVTQKKSFEQERELMIQKSAKKESDLIDQLAELKKDVGKKDIEIASLKMAISEISAKLGQATAQAEDSKKAQKEAIIELKSVKDINATLTKKMNALYKEISNLKTAPNGNN